MKTNEYIPERRGGLQGTLPSRSNHERRNPMMLGFSGAILLLGAAQGLVLGVLLLFRRHGNRLANRILSCIVGLLSVSILLHTLFHQDTLPAGRSHEILVELLTILSAPLIYFYTAALTTYQFRLNKRDLLHFLPLAVALVPAGIAAADPTPERQEAARGILGILTTAAMLGYVGASDIILIRHAKIVRENFSSLREVSLRWLRVFLPVLTAFWVFTGVVHLFFKGWSMDVVWMASCAVIYLIGYFGFAQPQVFSGPAVGPEPKTGSPAQKYEKSSLTPEMAEEHYQKLDAAMASQKLYARKDLSLSWLAQDLKIPLHHLSQIINERTGSNFYDYVNKQRIDEAARLLNDPSVANRSIASIGFDVGFNSLSAFNSSFRKYLNTTPSQFRKRRLPSSVSFFA